MLPALTLIQTYTYAIQAAVTRTRYTLQSYQNAENQLHSCVAVSLYGILASSATIHEACLVLAGIATGFCLVSTDMYWLSAIDLCCQS